MELYDIDAGLLHYLLNFSLWCIDEYTDGCGKDRQFGYNCRCFPWRDIARAFFEKNEPYDYLAYLRNWEELKDDPFYQETANRILVQEYKTIVEKAVAAYAELVSNEVYTYQEATALLTDKPLTDWPKTARRLLEQKE